jgi:AcrR family transcriptional regulator
VPKIVDREERRREIAAAVGRLARRRGLSAVSFREVAAEAGVSVALVQHYFGTKANLLVTSLDLESDRIAELLVTRLDDLGPDADALDRVRAVATGFLPVDDERRAAMLVYLGYAAAALTDQSLRSAVAFRNAHRLLRFMSDQLRHAGVANPDTEANGLIATLLGLALGVLLEQTDIAAAEAALNGHLDRLATINDFNTRGPTLR